jgi:hypothetical protein
MNLSDTIVPNSAQLNAEDLFAGPTTVTITSVEAGTSEQPVFIHLAEYPGRTYRPAKSMRRVLVAAWGADSSVYVGRRVTIFNDPTVKWAGQEVGGVRIAALSHINKPLTVALTVSRGKRAPFTVEPLPDTPDPVTAALEQIKKAGSMGELKAAWDNAGKRGVATNATVIAAKDQRKTELEVGA